MSVFSRSRGLILLLTLSLALFACSGDDTTEETTTEETTTEETDGSADSAELLLYITLEPERFDPMVEGFEAYYEAETGNTVDVSTVVQEEALIDLEAQAGAVQADVIINSSAALKGLQEAHDIFAPIEFSNTEGITEVYVEKAAADGYLPLGTQPYFIVYNTEAVSPEEVPQSWADVLDERWDGVFGMGDPETTNGAHVPLWLIVDYLGNSIGSPFGWEYFEVLGQMSPTLADSNSTIMAFVASGELQIGFVGLGSLSASADEGNPVGGVAPVEGVSGIPTAVGIVADSEVRDIAEMFAQWTSTLEFQEQVRDELNFISIRDDVEMAEYSYPLQFDPSQIIPLDDEWVAEERENNILQFSELMK